MHNITQVDISFALHKCVGVTVLSFHVNVHIYSLFSVKILYNINVATQEDFPKNKFPILLT